jgi:Domain of unknown function (DUF5753)
MQVQLGRLLEAAELPNITFQVIPLSVGAHAGMPGSFVFMQFTEASIRDVIYLGSMAGDLLLEADADVRRYRLAFEHLRAVAASPDASYVRRGLLG